jgi:hypothetical protein
MSNKTHAQLKKDLLSYVGKQCEGIELNVEISPRWDRLCFTFRWDGFDDLLLEERFRKVARLIPGDYFEKHCQGVVWLELTAGESIDEYLKQPRSEDVDAELPDIWKQLAEIEFFSRLEDEMVRISPADCPDDLSVSKRVLRASKLPEKDVRRSCLAFIRQAVFTDWEVLKAIRPIAESTPKPTRTVRGKKGR